MIETEFVKYIKKVVKTSKSRDEAVYILNHTCYPHTTMNLSKTEAEHFYYLFKKDEKEIKIDKDYHRKNYEENYKLKGY